MTDLKALIDRAIALIPFRTNKEFALLYFPKEAETAWWATISNPSPWVRLGEIEGVYEAWASTPELAVTELIRQIEGKNQC